jgi:hypothetical protein
VFYVVVLHLISGHWTNANQWIFEVGAHLQMEEPSIEMNIKKDKFMRSGTSLYETRKALTFRGACLWRLCSWQHSPFPMSHSLLMVQSSPAASRDTVIYIIFILSECMFLFCDARKLLLRGSL